ncbi:hypothetical protein [Streptomyces sp. NBC_01217]|uniref:hypothetical protein n=1 Tax=Streptomyces sp. NBC_01217 TaxID=2903779 RepID=UPI002E0EF2BA|nr:hypothetical protein OG507_18380 [Streptomyces sp. NBC_01217]
MIYFLAPLAAAVLVIAVATAVLIRRDRRRPEADADTLRIEAAATSGLREARRRAHAYRNRFLREHE